MQHINELGLEAVKGELHAAQRRVEEEKRQVTLLLARATTLTKENPTRMEHLVDVAYLCDRLSKDSELLEKEARRLLELIGQVACAVYVAHHTSDPDATATERVEGWLAKGTVKMDCTARVPDRREEPDKYRELCRHLGLSDEVIDNDVVRPHWPHLMELVTVATEQGLQPPPGIEPSSVRVRYKLANLRPKK